MRSVLERLARVARVVGVGPHLQAADAVRPAQDLARGRVAVERAGLDRRHAPDVNVAGGAVDGDLIALLNGGAVRGEGPVMLVHLDGARPDDAGPAHAAGDQRRVAGRAARLREDAPRLDHSMHVVGIRFDSDEDHVLTLLAPVGGRVGVEHGFAAGRAG